MVSPSHIKDRSLKREGGHAFTLLEVMLVTFISSFVFAGVLSAYIFLGRGLSRQANEEVLESRSRLALYYLTQDISMASAIQAANPGSETTGNQMTLTIPGIGSGVTYYCDWSHGLSKGILERQVGSGTYLVLLTNLSSFSLQFLDSTTHSVTVPSSIPSSPQIEIKQVCMTFTSTWGYKASGNLSNLTVVSPLLVLKNQAVLLDPTKP